MEASLHLSVSQPPAFLSGAAALLDQGRGPAGGGRDQTVGGELNDKLQQEIHVMWEGHKIKFCFTECGGRRRRINKDPHLRQGTGTVEEFHIQTPPPRTFTKPVGFISHFHLKKSP